jgi:hypothetical protein
LGETRLSAIATTGRLWPGPDDLALLRVRDLRSMSSFLVGCGCAEDSRSKLVALCKLFNRQERLRRVFDSGRALRPRTSDDVVHIVGSQKSGTTCLVIAWMCFDLFVDGMVFSRMNRKSKAGRILMGESFWRQSPRDPLPCPAPRMPARRSTAARDRSSNHLDANRA